ncbi:uncharacterized protein [Pyrus communis]|uniref:uncharacterized protein n=1 Tax=Pyrus communis TaxID=23211 RepID=UPI0035C22F3E
MSNLIKLDFTTLEVSERNYLKWIQDVKLHLTTKNLRPAIEEKTDNPVARHDWQHLRFQDFKSVNEYNSEQQYRAQKFIKFSNLISILLLAEKQNQLLMKNYQAQPTRATAMLEAHYSTNQFPKRQKRHGRGGHKPFHQGQQSQGPSKGGNKAHKHLNLAPKAPNFKNKR